MVSWALSFAAIGLAVWLWHHGKVQLRRLTGAISAVTGAGSEVVHLLRGIDDKTAFTRDFSRIDAAIRDRPLVGHAWAEFSRTLLRDDEEEGILATRNPADFFNDDIAYRSEVDLRTYDTIPNRLVGLGLLFTFIGLLLSLGIAGFGIQGDFEQVKTTLVQLLLASALKFSTSIAAIGASLHFVHRRNALQAEMSGALEAVCKEIERLTAPVTAEQLAQASVLELEQQTDLLERGSGDLANEIARQLDVTLRENLGSAIAPVAAEINGMASRISEINDAAMRYMIDAFTEKLGGAAREHNEAMAVLLEQVSRTVEDVPKRIEAASEKFSSVIAGAASAMDAAFVRSGKALSLLLEGSSRDVAASAAAFEKIVHQLDQATNRLGAAEAAMVERTERAESGVRAAGEQLAEVLARTDAASAALVPLASLAQRLDELAGSLTAATSDVKLFVTQSETTVSETRKATEAIAQAASQFADGVRGLDASLGSVFGQVGEGIDLFKAKVGNVVEAMDDQLSAAVETLSDAVASMGGSRAVSRAAGERAASQEASE